VNVPLRLKLIACEILYREICAVVSRSVNQVDVHFEPKGLHDIGQKRMRERLQDALAQVDESQYDAILFGYGLCNNGLVGLTARCVPLVVPRAHDCITLFLGDKEKYLEYFQGHPGVYFKTSGWVERGDQIDQYHGDTIQRKSGMDLPYEELAEKYGEDNAKFLREQLCDMTRNYTQITFIEMGIEPDDRFEQRSRRDAAERGWTFEKIRGDMSLIRQLVDGPWDEDRFQVVEPGQRVAPSFDRDVITVERD